MKNFYFLITILLVSCSSKVTQQTARSYNDSVNQQFWSADWSTDGRYVAVAGVDSLVRIYHSKNLMLHKSFPIASWIHIVQWHPDGKTLAVGTLEKYVQLIDIDHGDITMLNASGGSRAIDWNPTGQLLAVADLEGVIHIWNKDGSLHNTIDMQYAPEVFGESFLGIDWHPTKDILVATNFQINLFDASGRLLKVMEHTNPAAIILCAKWHPSGEFFVVGDYGHNWEGENVPSLLHFWSEDGALLKSVTGSKAEYRNLSWNQDGSRLATASDVLRIWSENGELLHEGPADSTNKLWGVDWSDEGKHIVTASRYKTIALWDNTAQLIQRIDVAKPQE